MAIKNIADPTSILAVSGFCMVIDVRKQAVATPVSIRETDLSRRPRFCACSFARDSIINIAAAPATQAKKRIGKYLLMNASIRRVKIPIIIRFDPSEKVAIDFF